MDGERAFDLPLLPIIPPPLYITRCSSTPAGMSTPPLQTLASVPFKWEEQPGKPRPCTDIIALPANPQPATFLLDPPPCRMMIVATKMPISPTTVLDGPYDVGRPRFSSFRFFRRRAKKHCSFDMSSSSSSSRSQESGTVDVLLCADDEKSCERMKMRRHGSFSRVSQARSSNHLWAAVCRSLKQGLTWKSIGKSKKCGQA